MARTIIEPFRIKEHPTHSLHNPRYSRSEVQLFADRFWSLFSFECERV
jgi:hypothetical protein